MSVDNPTNGVPEPAQEASSVPPAPAPAPAPTPAAATATAIATPEKTSEAPKFSWLWVYLPFT